MAALEAWTAKLPIYKDQTVGANAGLKILAGDTVVLVIKNDAGPETLISVVVTLVLDGGRTIQWDPGTTGIRTFDVVRTHQKHQFDCAGALSFQAIFAEVATEALLMSVGTMTIGGGVYSINITETGPGADGIPAAFAQAVVDKMNSYLSFGAVASYTITGSPGTQVMNLFIRGLDGIKWTAVTGANATITQPVAI